MHAADRVGGRRRRRRSESKSFPKIGWCIDPLARTWELAAAHLGYIVVQGAKAGNMLWWNLSGAFRTIHHFVYFKQTGGPCCKSRPG
jgi:hypothetical protein